jgi:hypothetical protein
MYKMGDYIQEEGVAVPQEGQAVSTDVWNEPQFLHVRMTGRDRSAAGSVSVLVIWMSSNAPWPFRFRPSISTVGSYEIILQSTNAGRRKKEIGSDQKRSVQKDEYVVNAEQWNRCASTKVMPRNQNESILQPALACQARIGFKPPLVNCSCQPEQSFCTSSPVQDSLRISQRTSCA